MEISAVYEELANNILHDFGWPTEPIRKANQNLIVIGTKDLTKKLCSSLLDLDKLSIEGRSAIASISPAERGTGIFYAAKSIIHRNKRRVEELDFPRSEIDYSKMIIVRDSHTALFSLFNTSTNKVSNMSAEIYFGRLDTETRTEVKRSSRVIVSEFDPYNTLPFELVDYEEVGSLLKVNLYTPPEWQLTGAPVENTQCPDKIMEFLEHLFPDDLCRKYVLSWIHHALIKRCQTYLVLNGKKGIGKGIFCNTILRALIGEQNYDEPPNSIFEDKFNSSIDRKRMLVFDEVRLTTKDHMSKVKRYINDMASIERKGIDASTATKIFSSNIISNNDMTDIRLEWDERRFTVPELTEDLLLDKWSKEEIVNFIDSFKNDIEMVKEFGYWVMNSCKFDRMDETTQYKGPLFWKIVYSSLNGWQRTIIDEALQGKNEIVLKDIYARQKNQADKDKMPKSKEKIMDFLKGYKHKGQYEVGTLDNGIIRLNANISEVNTNFVEEIEKNTLLNEEELDIF